MKKKIDHTNHSIVRIKKETIQYLQQVLSNQGWNRLMRNNDPEACELPIIILSVKPGGMWVKQRCRSPGTISYVLWKAKLL